MSFLLAAVLLASPVDRPLTLVLPDLRAVHFDPKEADFFAEHLAQQMKFPGVNLMTRRELQTMLGLERQRQLLGCASESSCITELANAMGAEGLVLADLAKVGTEVQVNLKVLAGVDGKTLATFSDRVSGEGALLDCLTRGAHQVLRRALLASGRRPPDELLVADQPAAVRAWWAFGAGGLVVAGAGGALFFLAQQDYRTLHEATASAPLTSEQASSALHRGQLFEPLGLAGLIVGGAAIVASASLLGVRQASLHQDVGVVSVVPVPLQGGLAVSLGGSF